MRTSLRGLILLVFGYGLLLAGGCATQPTRVDQQRLHNAALINVQLGIDYLRSGQLQRAYDKLKLALSQYPGSSKVRNAYALLMQRLGENKKAEENFRKAVQIAPKDSDAHNNFGVFLCSQKRYNEAQQQFKAALANPLYATPQYAYTNAGLCYLDQGKREQAKRAFDKALKVDPSFPPVLFQLAKQAADQGNWKRADHYLGRITGRAHYTPSILGLCIKVKQHLGDTNGATNCARDLYRLFPHSAEAKMLLDGGS